MLVAKQCYRCKHTLPVEQFAKNRTTRDGLQANCRACANVIRREYEVKHADAIALRHAEKLARRPREGATKACRSCGETKPMLEFYAHRSTVDGRASNCRECAKATQREWNARNRDKIRANNHKRDSDPKRRQKSLRDAKTWRLRLYGLDPEGYDSLLEKQGGVCAICGEPGQTWAERNLHVDHDHDTNEVRGLLCGRCNVAIGLLGDSVESLSKAIDYLTNPPAVRSDVVRGGVVDGQ